jgi:hypothetical protein
MNLSEFSLSSEINDIIIAGNLIPLIIACLVIFNELKPFSLSSQATLAIVGNEMVYIPHFNIFFCIFECTSLSDVHVDSLNLLIGINNISIELIKDEQRLRIFIYSSSKTDLSNQIIEFKPLLDNIFPNSYLLDKSVFRSEFSNYSLSQNGEYFLIKRHKDILIPSIEYVLNANTLHENSRVFRFDYPGEKAIGHELSSLNQFYSLTKFKYGSFFNFFGSLNFTHGITNFDDRVKKEFLYRAIIRFDLNGYASINNKESNVNLKQFLATYFKKSTPVEAQNKDISLPTTQDDVNLGIGPVSDINQGHNQICKEFCLVYRSSDISTKKLKNCLNRISFCKKALNNPNLLAFLKKLVKGECEQRREVLLSDLLKHLSLQQLYCLLINYLHIYNLNHLDKRIINLLNIMIQKQLEDKKNDSSGDIHHSVMDFLQLAPNQETEMA